MHHNHKPWKPLPATKPQHLTNKNASETGSNLAALQGATSAFASNPAPKLPDVNQLRKQYETQSQVEVSRGRYAGRQTVQDEAKESTRSPSRGRHLSPEHAMVVAAQSATARHKQPAKPGLGRNPSLIAARLASVSPSPVRTAGSPSPQNEMLNFLSKDALQRVNSALNNDRTLNKSFHTRATTDHGMQHDPTSALNFDDLPVLSSSKLEPDLEDVELSHHLQVAPDPRRVKSTSPVPVPANRNLLHAQHTADEALSSSMPLDQQMVRSKPVLPPPRKGRPLARSPLQADLTGSRQLQGLSREQAINRMADAMVASSLASTRNPSPAKAIGHSKLRRSASAQTLPRLPAAETVKLPVHHRPQKPMKQTLRKASADDEDELEITKRGRRHLVRKHPNMHHEGDRKRWRDKVTEMERKRYEGVFAANRGLLLRSADPRASPSRMIDPSSENNLVVNVVVRDIWERSRLSSHALEEIYDLVAPDEPLALNREQFVVGLWLIDQKLKGRKLPVRVSDSVWISVRHSQGIKIGSNARS